MRRTDFCHLTSSYEHPRLVGFHTRRVLGTRGTDSRLLHISATDFGGPHLVGAAEPLTPLSLLSRASPMLARGRGPESRRGRPLASV